MIQQRIEEAAFASWPATEQLRVDGWVARFGDGYTRRSNSATPLYASSRTSEQSVPLIEELYEARGLPPTFRLLSFTEPVNLQKALAERGYRATVSTLVQYLQLDEVCQDIPDAHALSEMSLSHWLEHYNLLSQAPASSQASHRKILERITARRLTMALSIEGEVVACGLVVLKDDFLGLFDIVTAPAARRQGHGRRLVTGMLGLGSRLGGLHAYLQVHSENEPAIRLYDKVGFRELYRYHYWTR